MITQFIQQAIKEEIGYTFPKTTQFYESDKLIVCKKDNKLQIGVRGRRDFLRAALIAKTNASCGDYEIIENGSFEDVCLMLDCSRNAVPTLETWKKLVRNLAMLGYNSCMLYMEDVYEVDGEPYFGYLRGRYTKTEMLQLDDYARSLGIELIPCIQTLAHLRRLKRWQEYKPHFDCQDIMLVGDERIYQLIENMFKTLSQCFSTKRIHIGMDEAWQLGLGVYLDKNGYQDRFEIFLNHLKKVNELAQKYGYKDCIMWSDMFAWTAKRLGCVDEKGEPFIPQEVLDKIPANVHLCHWKYHGHKKEDYEPSMKLHDGFHNPIWFASGTSAWGNFLPYNSYAAIANGVSLQVAKDHGVKHAVQTHWGDDGAETPVLSILTALAAFAYHANDVPMYRMNGEFKALTGYTVDEFNTLEALNTWSGERTMDFAKNIKIGLYNDVFTGIADAAISDVQNKKLAPAIESLKGVCKKGQYAYMFQTALALGEAAVSKFDMGVRLRKAYKAKDYAQMRAICDQMPVVIQRVDAFIQAYRKQWLAQNKPQGLEVQEIRLGGLKERLRGCMMRLEDYLAGRVDKIDELEQELLPHTAIYPDHRIGHLHYDECVSVNYMRCPFLT